MSHTPSIKFESPAESLVDSFSSTPGTHYSSLFPEDQTMTPQSFDDESIFGDEVEASLVASEKKPVKKRKSWGQQLPEPKTNLPPRKRAKTEDEKEQRRVERVLRNRRAAQSSRERKRQEVEALEAEKMQVELRNKELEARLAEMEARNTLLQIELEKMAGGNMRVFQGSSAASSPAAEQLRASTPVTFSQELFSAQPTATTVNPASLSPEIRPVPESSNASSSDTTQHPAVSAGRTTALDELNQQYSISGGNVLTQHDFNSYFNAPEPTESDRQFLEQSILPITDSFNLNFDHMDGHNDSVFDDFNLDDFLHQHEDQPAPEIQSTDAFVEKTFSMQPSFGASSLGCDDDGNAVSV